MRKRILSALLAFFVAFGIFIGFNRDVDAATKYSIKINYTANVVTIYRYGKPYKAMLCSTGKATPHKGTYKLSYRYRWHGLKGGVQGQYCVVITGNIWFHSVPYKKQSVSAIKRAEFDKLGTSCSMGCVRLMVRDAKWIYDNCKKGTPVTFYSSSNPGPLGRPRNYYLNGSPGYYAGWDPTDKHKNNPWPKETYYTKYTFNASRYLHYNPDIRQTVGQDTLRLKTHWIARGLNEGRRASDEFDVMFFKRMYPDLCEGIKNNQEIDKYYIQTARAAGKMGSELSPKLKPAFDASYITANNADWKSQYGTGTTPLWNHFVDVGASSNIQTSPIFSVSYYKKANPELAEEYGDDVFGYIRHFLEVGMKEGRQGSPNFNVKAFKDQHPELKYGNDYVKYFDYYQANYKKVAYTNPEPAATPDPEPAASNDTAATNDTDTNDAVTNDTQPANDQPSQAPADQDAAAPETEPTAPVEEKQDAVAEDASNAVADYDPDEKAAEKAFEDEANAEVEKDKKQDIINDTEKGKQKDETESQNDVA